MSCVLVCATTHDCSSFFRSQSSDTVKFSWLKTASPFQASLNLFVVFHLSLSAKVSSNFLHYILLFQYVLETHQRYSSRYLECTGTGKLSQCYNITRLILCMSTSAFLFNFHSDHNFVIKIHISECSMF